MKTRGKNREYYLQRRVDREIEKSMDALIKKKMREYEASKIIKSSINKHNRNAFYDFRNTVFRENIRQVDVFGSFGSTQSQFLNTFSMELQKSLFRNFF